MSFNISNPDYETVIRDSFASQGLMETLGARLRRISPGAVDIDFSWAEHLTQQHGFLHAGVATAIVDSACGYAALTLVPVRVEVLTVEFKVNFLRPAQGKEFLARGVVVKAGKQLTVCQGDVYADDDKLIARMTATMMFQTLP